MITFECTKWSVRYFYYYWTVPWYTTWKGKNKFPFFTGGDSDKQIDFRALAAVANTLFEELM